MSGTHGVFQHRSGYFFTILEEDFCEVYKKDGVNEVCRAYITSILEHLTNKQFDATGSDENIWVFMSLPEMERRMRKACSQRTIHKEIQGMIKDGYLSKRRAVGKATMEYKLNLRKIRNALEALPEPQSCNSATYHLANLQDQSSNSARLILQNDKNDLAELQPRIHIDIPVEETKKEEGEAPASLIDFTEEKKKRTDPALPVVQVVTDTASHSYRQNTLGNGATYADASRRGYDVQDHPGNSPDWPDSHTGNPTHSRQGQVALQVDEDEDDTPTEKVPVVKPSRQPLGAVLTEEQLDEAYDAYIAPSKQPASGLRITQAPTSKGVTQERLPEPKELSGKQRDKAEKTGLERLEKEYWVIIEEERKTKYSKKQRELYENSEGMKCLIADAIPNEKLRTGLRALDAFQRKSFTVLKFYGWLPNLTAEESPPAQQNGRGTHNEDDPELGVSGLPKLKPRKVIYG